MSRRPLAGKRRLVDSRGDDLERPLQAFAAARAGSATSTRGRGWGCALILRGFLTVSGKAAIMRGLRLTPQGRRAARSGGTQPRTRNVKRSANEAAAGSALRCVQARGFAWRAQGIDRAGQAPTARGSARGRELRTPSGPDRVVDSGRGRRAGTTGDHGVDRGHGAACSASAAWVCSISRSSNRRRCCLRATRPISSHLDEVSEHEVVLANAPLDPVALVEDELLLTLPFAPRHEASCGPASVAAR